MGKITATYRKVRSVKERPVLWRALPLVAETGRVLTGTIKFRPPRLPPSGAKRAAHIPKLKRPRRRAAVVMLVAGTESNCRLTDLS
jgi:hypothetical protein